MGSASDRPSGTAVAIAVAIAAGATRLRTKLAIDIVQKLDKIG
jgi:hypothetical protein